MTHELPVNMTGLISGQTRQPSVTQTTLTRRVKEHVATTWTIDCIGWKTQTIGAIRYISNN